MRYPTRPWKARPHGKDLGQGRFCWALDREKVQAYCLSGGKAESSAPLRHQAKGMTGQVWNHGGTGMHGCSRTPSPSGPPERSRDAFTKPREGSPTSCDRRRRGVGPSRQPGLAQHQRPLPLPLYARAYGGRQLRGLRRRALVLRRRHRQPSPRVRARAARAATWSYNPDSPPQCT